MYQKQLPARKMYTRKRAKKLLSRRGVEAVEAAITLPLLTIVMFSTIEIAHQWHVEKLLRIATAEAMKAGAASEGDSRDAIEVFNEHTRALGIQNARLVLNRRRFNDARTGQYLWCRGIAPANSNRLPAPVRINRSNVISGGWVYHRKEGL